MYLRLISVTIMVITIHFNVYGQILFTESFNVILDTGKVVQGSIIPDFKFQTQRENLIEFENMADITIRKKNHALTFANKIELSRFGKETLLSGGYLYAEYRKIYEERFVAELFSQVHWADARGLEFKYAGGINARFRIIVKNKLGLFAGVGPFYEFERWNYNGVSDTLLIPPNASEIKRSGLKIGSYANVKYDLLEKLALDVSIYHQSRVAEIFSSPRLAGSYKLSYQLTRHLGLVFVYQNIYDFKPVVPIKKLFNRVIFSVSIAF